MSDVSKRSARNENKSQKEEEEEQNRLGERRPNRLAMKNNKRIG